MEMTIANDSLCILAGSTLQLVQINILNCNTAQFCEEVEMWYVNRQEMGKKPSGL